MKKIILTVLLCVSLNAVGQTVFKNRKQDLRVERVIKNAQTIYKIYFGSNYLVFNNKNLSNMYLDEMLNAIDNGKTVYTFVENVSVKYVPFEDQVEVFTKGSSFILTRKQIIKIKEKF
jgi:hypothetical protein